MASSSHTPGIQESLLNTHRYKPYEGKHFGFPVLYNFPKNIYVYYFTYSHNDLIRQEYQTDIFISQKGKL